MSSIPSHWRELITQSGSGCPKLFYKFSSDENGYTILFTDLVGLWSESLSSESIHQFAKKYHTNIDPSQSKKQFQVLLQKLEQSLSSGANSLFHDEDSADESVVINSTINLPKPLQPLKWRFHLKPEASSEMAEHILRPSLHEAFESKKKLDSLLEVIDQKDHVISRLLERIDNSSLDLSLIFPRISRLKAKNGIIKSKEAQNQVPGLGKFNRGAWNDKFQSDSVYTGFQAQGLTNLVAGCEKFPQHTAKKHEQWLQKLPATPIELDSGKDNGAREAQEEGTSTSSDSDSDDFETQQRKRSYDHALSAELTPYNLDTFNDRPAKQVKIDRSQPPLGDQESSVVPTESLPDQRRDSNASTASNDSEDLDLPPLKADSSRTTRLGQLGNKPKSTEPPASREDYRMAQQLLPMLSSSSPPPQAPKSSTGQIPDNTQFGPSSPTASSLNPSTPRKLGRLKSQRPSNSATPEKSPTKHNPAAGTGMSNKETSIPTTPTRRLGRLGASRGTSQIQSQVLSQSKHLQGPANRETTKDAPEHSDSDASTSSTASEKSASTRRQEGVLSPPRLLPQESSMEFNTQARGTVDGGGVKAEEKVEDAEDKPELTKEEKAIHRRQELQKKIGPGGGAAQTARKKRKF